MQSVAAHAQWIDLRAPNTPRLPDGSPNLSAPVPRAADGKPDLSGVWEVVGTPSTTAPIAEGNRMPPYGGKAVTWRLKQYA